MSSIFAAWLSFFLSAIGISSILYGFRKDRQLRETFRILDIQYELRSKGLLPMYAKEFAKRWVYDEEKFLGGEKAAVVIFTQLKYRQALRAYHFIGNQLPNEVAKHYSQNRFYTAA